MKSPPGTRPSGPLEPSGIPDNAHRGWHRRGYLPHFDASGVIQSITYRLADSLPREVLGRYEQAVEHEPDEQRQGKLRRLIERFLDAGHGSCVLGQAEVARLIINTWRHFDDDHYILHAWVVMPNHVHVLCEPCVGHSLSAIVNSWKSFTAVHINRMLGRSGSLWMEDYWDRYIRDEEHYRRVVAYIHDNPVKAGLVAERQTWPWSSAALLGARSSELPCASGPEGRVPGGDSHTL